MTEIDDTKLDDALEFFISHPEHHSRLLNTFSMMENMGAQKIHRFQRFGFSSEFILRHAAEEARHALYFKSRIKLLGSDEDIDFSRDHLVAPTVSRNYLRVLDLDVNRHLKTSYQLVPKQQYFLSYLFTTLLIELRANNLYPRYEKALRKSNSPITIRSIIAEEDRHLSEIQAMLRKEFAGDLDYAMGVLKEVEERLYVEWLCSIVHGLSAPHSII
jgi:hypothetical protein